MSKRLHEMTVTQIDVLRHGPCEGGDIFRGHFDAPLTAAGLAQMQKVSVASGTDWDCIISSPLQRCWQFAQNPMADQPAPTSDSPRVWSDGRLIEMSFGDWDGKKIADIWEADYQRISAWSLDPANNTPPNGEPLAHVGQRVGCFLNDCISAHQGKKILLVTHGGIIRVLLTQLLGMPLVYANRWEVPYACLSRMAVYHDRDGEVQEPRYQLVAHNFITVAK